ncbi:hypothetical protein [Leeuwenhoekiella sp. NPDC079379]
MIFISKIFTIFALAFSDMEVQAFSRSPKYVKSSMQAWWNW